MYSCLECPSFALCYKCNASRKELHLPEHEFEMTGPQYRGEAVGSDAGASSVAESSSEVEESDVDSSSEADS